MNADRIISALSKLGEDVASIRQLRKIAVALAISGKLDAGRARLQPAEIISSVDRVKDTLVKQGVLPKQKRFAEVTLDQLPEHFSDPSRFAPLGSIARIEKGQTAIQRAKPGPFPMVVTAAERASSDHYDFDAAAAIVPLVSSTGHGNASLNRLHYQEGRFALGTILAAILPHAPNLISARFIFEYLSAFKDELLVTRMSGTANVTLSIGRISEVPFPLVCPEVQKKLDELMVLCDRLEASLTFAADARSRLLNALLAEALVPAKEALHEAAE